jgi:predicted TIM-barrel fold metal-dependent hydrolase
VQFDHGFDVIDSHHHYDAGRGLAALGAGAGGGSAGAAEAATELASRLQTMDAQGVRGAVVLAGNGYLRPRGLEDTAAVNDAVAAYQAATPERLVAAVGVVEPVYGEAGYAEVDRCKRIGLAGIGFHNGQQGVAIDHPLMIGLLEKIGDAGLVPFVHALGNELETLWQVDSVAGKLPELPMVVMDVFHDINQVKSLPEVAARRPNLYFDLSLTISFEFLGLRQVQAIGAHRFLYGTDYYSWPVMTKPFGNLLSEIVTSPLPDDDKAAILGGNIRTLLGVE